VSLCRSLGRIAVTLAQGCSIDRIETEFLGRIAERDTRLLGIQALVGVLGGHTEEEANEVNAPAMAAERGIEVGESKRTVAHDYTDLIRVTVTCGDEEVRVAGTLIGRRNRAHLLEAWGQRFDLQLEPNLSILRYKDMPGRIGHAGTVLGQHGINVISAAVGRQPEEIGPARPALEAVMVITTDSPVPRAVIDEIVAGDGFVAGYTLTL
jgi:D-3-phosphoglycerate dehydrogenase